MSDFTRRWAPLCLILLAIVAVGCGGGEDAEKASRDAELAALQERYDGVKAKRVELAEAIAAAEAAEEEGAEEPAEGEEVEGEGEAAEGEGEAAEGEGEAAAEPMEAVKTPEELQEELDTMVEEFMTALVGFINADPPYEGEPMNEYQLAAMRLKSAEDMVVAQEFIDEGGDYRRAIQIYDDALNVDPDNPDLLAAKARAEELRYMTEERFAAAKKGMTEDEVRAALGQVNLRNIRNYEDKGVVSWFYTKEDGGAAGVFFREKGDVLKVYQVDYEAVKPPTEE